MCAGSSAADSGSGQTPETGGLLEINHSMAASPQVLISLADDILTLFIRPDDYLEGHCATLHIQLDIAAAADFRPGYVSR